MTTLAKTISRHDLTPGLTLFLAPMGVKDAVTIEGSFRGGSNFAPRTDRLLPDVLAHMLDEGTRRRSKAAIQEALDRRGMSLEWSADPERIRFTGHCRRDDLPELLSIIAEEMQEPALPAASLAVVKERLIGGLRHSKDDTRVQGGIALRRLLYPKGHPNWRPTVPEAVKMVLEVTRAKLRQYHRKTFGRGSLLVVIAGDVEVRRVAHAVRKTLGALRVVKSLPPTVRTRPPQPRAMRDVVTVPKKPSVDVFIATPLPILKYHPDYYPLLLASRILGVPGFSGRLMRAVREKEGLTYGIYSYLKGFDDGAPGHLEVWGTFAPALLSQGIASTLREFRRLAAKGVTAGELREQQSMIKGAHLIALSTTGGRASALLGLAEDGKPSSYLDEYLKEVEGVTRFDVSRVLRNYGDPRTLAIVAAGSIDKLPKVD